MKRVGRLYNKVLVEGDKNELKDSQVLVQKKIDTLDTGKEHLELYARVNGEVVKISPEEESALTEEYPALTTVESIYDSIELCPNMRNIIGLISDRESEYNYAIACTFYQNSGDFYIKRNPYMGDTAIVILDAPIDSLLPEINSQIYTSVVDLELLSSHRVTAYNIPAAKYGNDPVIPGYSSIMPNKLTFNNVVDLINTVIIEELPTRIQLPEKSLIVN